MDEVSTLPQLYEVSTLAQFVTDLITKFWDDDLTEEEVSKTADFLRECGAPKNLSNIEVIKNCKMNPIDQACFLEIMAPRALKCAYRGGHTLLSNDYIRKQFEMCLPVFAGKAPTNHPFPDFFAGTALHIGFMDNKIEPLCNIWMYHEININILPENPLTNAAVQCCQMLLDNPHIKALPFLKGFSIKVPTKFIKKCQQILMKDDRLTTSVS